MECELGFSCVRYYCSCMRMDASFQQARFLHLNCEGAVKGDDGRKGCVCWSLTRGSNMEVSDAFTIPQVRIQWWTMKNTVSLFSAALLTLSLLLLQELEGSIQVCFANTNFSYIFCIETFSSNSVLRSCGWMIGMWTVSLGQCASMVWHL